MSRTLVTVAIMVFETRLAWTPRQSEDPEVGGTIITARQVRGIRHQRSNEISHHFTLFLVYFKGK